MAVSVGAEVQSGPGTVYEDFLYQASWRLSHALGIFSDHSKKSWIPFCCWWANLWTCLLLSLSQTRWNVNQLALTVLLLRTIILHPFPGYLSKIPRKTYLGILGLGKEFPISSLIFRRLPPLLPVLSQPVWIRHEAMERMLSRRALSLWHSLGYHVVWPKDPAGLWCLLGAIVHLGYMLWISFSSPLWKGKWMQWVVFRKPVITLK